MYEVLMSIPLLIGAWQGTSGEEWIARMRAQNQDWPATLSFVQTTTYPDGREETWYESMSLPGKLRIDVAPFDGGSGFLFREDSLYVRQSGEVVQSTLQPHVLLILLYDARRDAPSLTAQRLRDLGIALDVVHEATWEGRDAVVIGGPPGDESRTQFWIDKERLVPVRVLQVAGGNVTDYRMGKHVQIAGSWMETEVLFYRGDDVILREEYHDIRPGASFDVAIFDPDHPEPPRWAREAASRN